MKKHPILLRLTFFILLITAFLLKPRVSEWLLLDVLWNKYPESVKQELWNFSFQCTGFSPFTESWIRRVEEEDLPSTIREWLPGYIEYHDTSNTNEYGFKFDFEASTPYFFKCQHDQYQLIWTADNSSELTNTAVKVRLDENNIWQDHLSTTYPPADKD